MLLHAGITLLCMTVLWLPVVSGATKYIYMTLTNTLRAGKYLFTEDLFQMLHECFCKDINICKAKFSIEYNKYYDYSVVSVTPTSAIETQSQAHSCRYYACKSQYPYLKCQSNLKSTSFTQSINYTRSSACPNMCTTFLWSNMNEKITSSPSNLLSSCDNSCKNQANTFTTVKTSRSTTRTTRSTTSTMKTKSTYITTEESPAPQSSTQLTNETLTVNVTLQVKHTEENSSVIILAVVVPILIAIIVGVVLAAFLWRRRQLWKQELHRRNAHGSPVALPTSSHKKETGNSYLSLNSQRQSTKNERLEENTSSYESVDINDKAGHVNTFASNNRVTDQSNSSKVLYSNASNFTSSLQNRHKQNVSNLSTNENITGKRIFYFSDRNNRDESDDVHQSIYSLASCQVSANDELQAAEIQQLTKKQEINTRHKENENSKSRTTLLKQENLFDYCSPHKDKDNKNDGYLNVGACSSLSNGVNNAEIISVLSVPIVDDKASTINSTSSGTYNNIALEPDNIDQIHQDIQQDDINNGEDSSSYYYSSNAGILQNIAKEKNTKKDVTEKIFRSPMSSSDKGKNTTSDVDTEYSTGNLSDHDQINSINSHVYSKLREEDIHIFHPYNSLQLQN